MCDMYSCCEACLSWKHKQNKCCGKIIESYSNLEDISVFAYSNKSENKVCAFNYNDVSGEEGIGLAILRDNKRGTYEVEYIGYDTGIQEFVNPMAYVDKIPCAVIAVTDKSPAVLAEAKISYTESGAQRTIKSNIRPEEITFIVYDDEKMINAQKNIELYDRNGNIIEQK